MKTLSKMGMVVGLILFALVAFNPAKVEAGAVISSPLGTVRLGVNDEGHLNYDSPTDTGPLNSSRWGVSFLFPDGTYRDSTSPGCFCEGFGIAATSGGTPHSGYADVSVTGVVNLTADPFSSTATTATATAHLTSLSGFSVKQEYFPSAGAPEALFQDRVTLTNLTGGLLTDVRYTRVMDWDIPPTEFREFVTIGGLPATDIIHTDNNGFDSPDPYRSYSDFDSCVTDASGNFTDCGPSDHGAVFDFGFGDLADGASKTFNIYYGATGTEADAFAALGEVGAEIYSFGQSSTTGGPSLGTPATFIFAFGGVGGTPLPDPTPGGHGTEIPEPSTMLMLGLGACGAFLKSRTAKAAK